MFRKAQSLGCILVLSAIAILATPDFSQARGGGGGGGGGGGHFGGGGGGGGGHFGGASHFGGAHVGGFHPGATHLGGFRNGFGRFPGGLYGVPYLEGVPTYDPGDFGSYGTAPTYSGEETYGTPQEAYRALYPPPVVPPAMTTATNNNALFTVNVPADAEIWVDGTEMTSPGAVRQFQSPPLAPGNYTYQIRAQWNENGLEVSQTQKVEFAPGSRVNVSFPVTPAAAQTSATKQS